MMALLEWIASPEEGWLDRHQWAAVALVAALLVVGAAIEGLS